MVFPVVMYGCESWTVKKAEHWRIDAFELWCWRRLLRAPWTARRSNQSILKEISPGGLPSMGSPRVGHNWSDLAAAAAFTWKTDAEAEAPVLWPSYGKNWLTEKAPNAGKDWRREEKGTTEDEMVVWHHQLSEFTQTHDHQVSDAIQPSHPLSAPSPPAPNPSQHQSLFQWVNSSHEVAKVLEVQL